MKHLLFAITIILVACGGDEDRQEVLSKLRGIGVVTTPLVSPPSVDASDLKKVEVTVHAALPIGQTATIEPFVDEISPFAISLSSDQIVVKAGSESYQTYPGFQILTFKADLTVPTVETFARLGGAGQARYGFILRSGSEEEKITGNFLVYPDGSPELAWTHPEATIVTPAAGMPVVPVNSEFDIAATTVTKNDEELKIGWFASNGEITNRRAKSTKWEIKDAGEHTLIFTARGKKSRGFVMQIVTVKAE